MARLRVFVSSTYYDLRHIRTSLQVFIRSLGFEPVLSERGDVAYVFDKPLDESCYREISGCDLYVLIVGGRYGSETSQGRDARGENAGPTFFEHYDSITRRECSIAHERGVPAYILIEKGVYAEYQTYRRNKGNENVQYAHVDSVNVFRFVEELERLRTNNPIHAFENTLEIEDWLREQWVGLFAELLRRRVTETQFVDVTQEMRRISETTETLKTYLEEAMRSLDVKNVAEMVREETDRLLAVKARIDFSKIAFVRHLQETHGMPEDCVFQEFQSSTSFADFKNLLKVHLLNHGRRWCNHLKDDDVEQEPFERLREHLGLPAWSGTSPTNANSSPLAKVVASDGLDR